MKAKVIITFRRTISRFSDWTFDVVVTLIKNRVDRYLLRRRRILLMRSFYVKGVFSEKEVMEYGRKGINVTR